MCSCFESNLNGEYYTQPWEHQYRGIIWEMWLGDYSLRATEIKVRPTSYSFSESSGGPTLPQPPTYPPSSYPTPPELPLRQQWFLILPLPWQVLQTVVFLATVINDQIFLASVWFFHPNTYGSTRVQVCWVYRVNWRRLKVMLWLFKHFLCC